MLCRGIWCLLAAVALGNAVIATANDDLMNKYVNQIVSLTPYSKFDNENFFLSHKNKLVSLKKDPDMKQEKKEATWKIRPGLSHNDAVSIESTLLPGYFLHSKIPSKVETGRGAKLKPR